VLGAIIGVNLYALLFSGGKPTVVQVAKATVAASTPAVSAKAKTPAKKKK
jgi:hypothetical protein